MKIKYRNLSLRGNSLDLVEIANGIIEDYQARGYELTLRQLYYQLVAKGYIENSEKLYKRLGGIIAKARDAGLVDWLAIVDRTRTRIGLTTWKDHASLIDAALRQFRMDKWIGQDYRVFVWVEKEALAGVVEVACQQEDIQVSHLSCRGYMSASTIWKEAQNMKWIYQEGQIPVIIHLGDHDPSGLDMTRDNIERMELYSGLVENNDFYFRRVALNYNQIEEFDPPPNPAKLSDSRAEAYIDQYGYSSWELDALDPDVLIALIQDTIQSYRDQEKWIKSKKAEEDQRQELMEMVEKLRNE